MATLKPRNACLRKSAVPLPLLWALDNGPSLAQMDCRPAPADVARLIEVSPGFHRVEGALAELDPHHRSAQLAMPGLFADKWAEKPPLMIDQMYGRRLPCNGSSPQNLAGRHLDGQAHDPDDGHAMRFHDASWPNGMPLSLRGSAARPSTRSPMLLRMISSVPPAMRMPAAPNQSRSTRAKPSPNSLAASTPR